MDGILKAKARGVHFGAQPKLSEEQVADLKARRDNGALIKELMADFKLSKASVYRYLKQE